MVNAYKTSFNVSRWTTLGGSPTSKHWLIWRSATRQWEHLIMVIDIYLQHCRPILLLMFMLRRMDFTPCKAKEITDNRTWAIKCILYSRNQLMAMSYKVIQATINHCPNHILTATHSMLVHSPTSPLLVAPLLVRSMTLTSARCLDTACKHYPFFTFKPPLNLELWTCSIAFLLATIYHSLIQLFGLLCVSDTNKIYLTYISHFELLFILLV